MSLNFFSSQSVLGSMMLDQTKDGIQDIAHLGIDLLEYRERVFSTGVDKVKDTLEVLGIPSSEVIFEGIKHLESERIGFIENVIREVFDLGENMGDVQAFILNTLISLMRFMTTVIQSLF